MFKESALNLLSQTPYARNVRAGYLAPKVQEPQAGAPNRDPGFQELMLRWRRRAHGREVGVQDQGCAACGGTVILYVNRMGQVRSCHDCGAVQP